MKDFCLYPFNRAHLSINGNVYVCCSAWLNKPIGNFFKDDFMDIWNSEAAMTIRESIFDHTFRFCNKKLCPRIIEGHINNEIISGRLKNIIQEKKLYLDKGPEHLSLNYDYSCNLYCKSCRNQQRVMDYKSAEKIINFQGSLLRSDLFKAARRIVITGAGEPFASRVFMDLLNKINISQNPDLKITLRTNGNLLTQKNWNLIKNAHYAIDAISISIDAATEKTYSLLRRGGNFEKLLNNLKFLSELKKTKKIKLGLNFVVLKDNFKEMIKFVELAKNFHCDEVAFTKLMDRGTYKEDEYLQLAIHNPEHPQFQELKMIINDPAFKDPIVSFNNLSNLLEYGS